MTFSFAFTYSALSFSCNCKSLCAGALLPRIGSTIWDKGFLFVYVCVYFCMCLFVYLCICVFVYFCTCKCNSLSADALLPTRIASIWDLGQKPAVMADKRQTPVWKGSIKTFLPQFKLCKYWNNFFRNIHIGSLSYIRVIWLLAI